MEDESLADLFGRAARSLRQRQRAALEDRGVTPAQARALGVLARHGTLRAGDLAAHLRIAPRSGTEVIDDLEARRLVERRPDPADRRAVLVALTDDGERTSAAARAAQTAGAEAYFARLDVADRAELARLLRALRD